MSEAALPDDVREWPDDPHDLFGLLPQAGMRDLRRAYAALIRRFKPEHYPQQFRRIRDAYESLEWQMRWRERAVPVDPPEMPDGIAPGGSAPLQPTADAGTADSSLSSSIPPDSDPAPSARPQPDEDIDGIWSRAIRHGGDWQEIYRNLVCASERATSDDVLFCRLYWLLTIAPGVDPGRKPVDWLAAGLARNNSSRRIVSLYCHELKRRPDEALRERSASLLTQPRPLWQLSELARHRWRALRTANRLEDIAADHRRLKDAFFSARAEWIALLLNAVEVLIWSEGETVQPLLGNCLCEIKDTDDVQVGLGEARDRHDLLLTLAEDYRQFENRQNDQPGFQKGLMKLLPELWLNTDAGRVRLLEILGSWVDHPDVTLDGLDILNESHRTALAYITSVLASLAPREREEAKETRVRAVSALIAAHDWDRYRAGRTDLLHECLRTGIWVDEILDVMHATPQFARLAEGTTPSELRADLPVKCLIAGHRAFW